MDKKYKYLAFISYRHLPVDKELAGAIHSALEDFKVPKELDPTGKYKEIRLFRDREELTTKDLSLSIDEALKDSEYLIVVCSKRTPDSIWCTREVEEFRKTHRDDQIIPVLVEGEPADSFSNPLKNLKVTFEQAGNEELNEEGPQVGSSPAKVLEHHLELLAADLRPEAVRKDGFVGYETLEKSDPRTLNGLVKESKKILKTTEIYRIMATILGVSYGDLKQRQKEKRMRRLALLGSGAAVILLAFGTAMTFLYLKSVASERLARQENALMIMNQADRQNQGGNRVVSLLVADEAKKRVEPKMEKYPEIVAQEEKLLNDVLLAPNLAPLSRNRSSLSHSAFDIVPKHNSLVLGEDKNLVFVDLNSGKELFRVPFNAPPAAVKTAKDSSFVFVSTTDGWLWKLPLASKKPEALYKHPSSFYQQLLEENGEILAGSVTNREVDIIDTKAKKVLHQIVTTSEDLGENLIGLTVPPKKDSVVLVRFNGSVRQLDLKTGSLIKEWRPATAGKNFSASASADGELIALSSTEGLTIYHLTTGKILEITDSVYTVSKPIFSPDKKTIYKAESGISSWDTTTGAYKNNLLTPQGTSVKDLYMNPRGDQLIAVMRDQRLGWYNLKDATDLNFHEISAGKFDQDVNLALFTPNGQRLVMGSQDGTVKIFGQNDELKKKILKGQIIGSSRDHNKLFLLNSIKEDGVEKYQYKTYDFKSGKEQILGKSTEPYFRIVSSATMTKDASRFAITSMGGVINILNPKGQKIANTSAHAKNGDYFSIVGLSFGSDDAKLYSLGSSGDAMISDGKTGKQIKQLMPEKKQASNFLLSEDDSLMAINYLDESFNLVDTRNGQSLDKGPGQLLRIQGREGKVDQLWGLEGKKYFKRTGGKSNYYATTKESTSGSDRFQSLDYQFVSNDGRYYYGFSRLSSKSETENLPFHGRCKMLYKNHLPFYNSDCSSH